MSELESAPPTITIDLTIPLRAFNVSERCPDGTCINEVPYIDFSCEEKVWNSPDDTWYEEHYVTQVLFMLRPVG